MQKVGCCGFTQLCVEAPQERNDSRSHVSHGQGVTPLSWRGRVFVISEDDGDATGGGVLVGVAQPDDYGGESQQEIVWPQYRSISCP